MTKMTYIVTKKGTLKQRDLGLAACREQEGQYYLALLSIVQNLKICFTYVHVYSNVSKCISFRTFRNTVDSWKQTEHKLCSYVAIIIKYGST